VVVGGVTLGEPFAAILVAARQGEEWAWAAIYRDLVGPVTGYLASRGAEEPEDLASEAFLQVARGLASFEGDEAAFRSWVFVIAHRRMQDARRAAKRRPQRTDADADEALAAIGAAGSVEDEAMGALRDERLAAALERLGDAHREVLALRVVGDLSVSDTATIMRKSPGAIKVLQHRALRALRKALDEAE
jgi:RNA polymerase sigma factor (sigma-70 family)